MNLYPWVEAERLGGSAGRLIADYLFGKAAKTVWYLANSNGANMLTLFVLPTLPFAMSLAQDREAQGLALYTVSKLLTGALAGFLTVGLGLLLFVLVGGLGKCRNKAVENQKLEPVSKDLQTGSGFKRDCQKKRSLNHFALNVFKRIYKRTPQYR